MSHQRDFTRAGQVLDPDQAAPYLQIIRRHFPDKMVLAVTDRGTWLRKIIRIDLEDGEIYYIKIDTLEPEAGWSHGVDGECHERDVQRLLSAHHLHVVPPIHVVDTSRELLPNPYVIQEHRGGTRLDVLINHASNAEAQAIYTMLGRFYRQLHTITNDKAGLWIGSTPDRPWGNPTIHMLQAEIVDGSGAAALANGIITLDTYDRSVRSWQDNMDYLLDFQPALIHYSPFPWNIYLEQSHGGWEVVKLMSLGDVMWWEPAYDLASLQFPPFAPCDPLDWQAFATGYGFLPARKRILLYTVLQTLCAMMGSYWELKTEATRSWTPAACTRLNDVLDELDRLS